MKGQYSQECNITACQKPNSAFWLNRLNNQYYCEDCARRLNNDEFNKKDCLRLLGDAQMCVEVRVEEEEKGINTDLPDIVQNLLKEAINRVNYDFSEPLSGREKRRERRKQERKRK